MQFTYINFLPFLDDLRQQNLDVSFFIYKKSIYNQSFSITSILHHKDYQFPKSWIHDTDISIKNLSHSGKQDFLKQISNIHSVVKNNKYTLLDSNENNFLLSSILKDDYHISFNSIIHDQILSADFIDYLEAKYIEHSLSKKQLTNHTITAIFEYEMEKFSSENFDTLTDTEIQQNLERLYSEKLNKIVGNFMSNGICPLYIMPVNPSFNIKMINYTSLWLEKNNSEDNINKVLQFFNHPDYKHIFIDTLKNTEHRDILERYIFSIDKNTNESFKKNTYQNFPFLKFDIPTVITNIKDNEIQINISNIIKLKTFSIYSDSTTSNRNYITTSHSLNVINHLPKIMNYCSKFYSLSPFTIKKINGDLFSIGIKESNKKKNQDIGQFIDIMLYELFIVAKPIDQNIVKTLESILPLVHTQVLDMQIPQVAIKNTNINKF